MQAFFDGTGVVLWPGMDTKRFSAFVSEELPRIAALIARLGRAALSVRLGTHVQRPSLRVSSMTDAA